MLMKMLMDRRCAVSSFADPLTRNINFARLGLSSATSQHSLTPPTHPIACGPIATYAQIKLITAPPLPPPSIVSCLISTAGADRRSGFPPRPDDPKRDPRTRGGF